MFHLAVGPEASDCLIAVAEQYRAALAGLQDAATPWCTKGLAGARVNW
ncbi:MAG: hypothetical protein ACR2H3_06250 [Acidimicrobiales bacterium]